MLDPCGEVLKAISMSAQPMSTTGQRDIAAVEVLDRCRLPRIGDGSVDEAGGIDLLYLLAKFVIAKRGGTSGNGGSVSLLRRRCPRSRTIFDDNIFGRESETSTPSTLMRLFSNKSSRISTRTWQDRKDVHTDRRRPQPKVRQRYAGQRVHCLCS